MILNATIGAMNAKKYLGSMQNYMKVMIKFQINYKHINKEYVSRVF